MELAVRLVIKKEGDISVVTSTKLSSNSPSKQSELVVVELPGTERENQREVSSASTAASRTTSDTPIKEEPSEEEDASSIVTMSSATPVNMDDYIVRPRRCSRLQKDEVLKQHDSDACPLGKVSKNTRKTIILTGFFVFCFFFFVCLS